MRTSLLIRRDVWKALKIQSAQKEVTLSSMVSDILERELLR